ncbi:MAG: 50S ribosomal protein L3, partial [Deltaproteobacteria bacterium]|nr:50S ribosomal protein L3 [Deltaproteobacteria bacterium]
KGKGYAGVVKRWGFRGGPGGHGSHFHRAPGAIGACATPSRVFKGRKLPGQMGNSQVTVQGLEIAMVDTEQNLLLVKGSVPGGKNSIVIIKESVKKIKKAKKN